MATKLQTLREEREDGFTLIELLVVILIIGILSAIAIPAFLNQRKAAVDASVKSDVHSASIQVATWQTKNFNRAIEPITVTAKDAQASGAITSSPLAFISTNTLLQGVAPASVASDSLKDSIKVSEGSKLFITQGDKSIISSYCIYGVNSGGDISASKGFIYDSENSGFYKEGMASYCNDNIPSDVTGAIAGGDVAVVADYVNDQNYRFTYQNVTYDGSVGFDAKSHLEIVDNVMTVTIATTDGFKIPANSKLNIYTTNLNGNAVAPGYYKVDFAVSEDATSVTLVMDLAADPAVNPPNLDGGFMLSSIFLTHGDDSYSSMTP